MTRLESKTSPLWLAAAWTVVTIPLAWGIYQTATKSVPLFRASGAATTPAPPPPEERPDKNHAGTAPDGLVNRRRTT